MDDFEYANERFADLQMLRYRLDGFEHLSLQQKKLIYYLSEAALCGRDITTDQFGKYNLLIRKTLEAVYEYGNTANDDQQRKELVVYLKRIWFSNGIYHHYGCEKMLPQFSQEYLRQEIMSVPAGKLPLADGMTKESLCDEIFPVIFNPDVFPKRVNKAQGEDLIVTSACNFYENISQQEAEKFYSEKKPQAGDALPSFGLNSKLIKADGQIKEEVYKKEGLYGKAISHIIYWLDKAKGVAENEQQRKVISLLIKYYISGDLEIFDEYSIEWLREQEGTVDFINGFIEVYGDPLGLKGSWEGLVEYKDMEATKRTRLISDNAQWFEDHSPVDIRFKKKVVKGVTAHVVCAAMLGGDEYPSTAIGINLPNAEWIRAQYGSKSVSIRNIIDAYNKASRGNGFHEEFIPDQETRCLIEKYGDLCDEVHTDLHECLGHGSGQLLAGVDPDALKAYGSTIEEARADLYGLYYIADDKMVELGILPDKEAYKSHYYTYMMNGLMTQMTRIKEGNQIEEAHMRNRALIAHWVHEHSNGAVCIVKEQGKSYISIDDYDALRSLFATLLREIQRIKSEGDYDAAKEIVERYGVKVDEHLHREILSRYEKLNLAPYKGFINPRLTPVYNAENDIIDIAVDYSESYSEQMLRYSKQYGFL